MNGRSAGHYSFAKLIYLKSRMESSQICALIALRAMLARNWAILGSFCDNQLTVKLKSYLTSHLSKGKNLFFMIVRRSKMGMSRAITDGLH